MTNNGVGSTAPKEDGSDHIDSVALDGDDSDAEWDIEDQEPADVSVAIVEMHDLKGTVFPYPSHQPNSAYKANIRITDIS